MHDAVTDAGLVREHVDVEEGAPNRLSAARAYLGGGRVAARQASHAMPTRYQRRRDGRPDEPTRARDENVHFCSLVVER